MVIEQSSYDHVDRVLDKGEFIDIDIHTKDRLYVRYSPIADSGVELERIKNHVVIWRVHVRPVGVSHSKYRHRVEVEVKIEDGKIIVHSIGAKYICEVHDLASGQLISRNIHDHT